MEASDIKKIKDLEDENCRLKQMFADLSLECRALNLSRTVYRYQPDMAHDEPVIIVLQELAERNPCYGFSKVFQFLRRQGHMWNHKRVHRIYYLLQLNIRRKGKRRLPFRCPSPLTVRERLNQSWPIDFMHDARHVFGGFVRLTWWMTIIVKH